MLLREHLTELTKDELLDQARIFQFENALGFAKRN